MEIDNSPSLSTSHPHRAREWERGRRGEGVSSPSRQSAIPSSITLSLSGNFGFDEVCKQCKRFLPPQIAGLGRNGFRDSFLHHA